MLAQLDELRRHLGPKGNVQITDGEVTLLPDGDEQAAAGHLRRRPAGDEKPQVERVADDGVEAPVDPRP